MSFWKERGLPEPSMMKISNFAKEIEEYILKIEYENKKYLEELTDIKEDSCAGLEKLTEKYEGDGKTYLIGIKSRSGSIFYSNNWSPLTIKIEALKSKLNQLIGEKDGLVEKIKEVSKKANRHLSRAKHSEENLREILSKKVKLVYEFDDSEISLPYNFGEDIGEISLKKSKLFFLRSRTFKKFSGSVYLNKINVNKQRSHSFPLKIGDRISLCIDVDYFENYRLKLVDNLCK
jgi:hypothetical protein